MSELAEKLIEENLQTKNPYLDLGNCDLNGKEDDLYKPLRDATHLETLILSDKWYNFLTKQYQESKNRGDSNFLEALPSPLPQNLKTLIAVAGGHWRLRWEIEDITALEGCQQLETLHLYKNEIKEVGVLKKLKQLRHVEVGENKIREIYLEDLPQLERLDINFNPIDTLVLRNIPHLKDLELTSARKVKRKVKLENLPALKILDLSKADMEDYSFIGQLAALQQLRLERNDIQDLSFLKGLENLEILTLTGNGLVDIADLQNLTKLQNLRLNENHIEDITALANLSHLQHINLMYNQIEGNVSFAKATQLRSLNVEINKITHLDLPTQLAHSEVLTLHLSNNQLQDITFLNTLKHLDNDIALSLVRNQIKDITALEEMHNLVALSLDSNPVEDITVLKNLKNLVTLSLDNTLIEDIALLASLPKLATLSLKNTRVNDFSILKKFVNLKKLHFDVEQLPFPPIWYAALKFKEGKLGDYIHLADLPQTEKIWQFIASSDQANQPLARELAKGQGWTEEEFEMYQSLVKL